MAAAMDTVTLNDPAGPAGGLLQNPAVRQVLAMIGIAASVALGVAVILWSRTPEQTLLYANLTQEAAAEVAQSLQAAGIPFDVDSGGGAVRVPARHVDEARLHLASEGLPNQSGVGLELMQDDPAFGISQFMETKRYHHALEIELGRTIGKLKPVRAARVHLAMGKDTVFVRDKTKATASVLLDLHAGRALAPDQVAAIVHMVASSIPELDAEQVTVIDQFGKLLSAPDNAQDMALSAAQFELTRKLEADYVARIEDLLAPIVGFGRVRAQVVADLDFTVSEQTQESYDPARSVVRSEMSESNERRDGTPDAGIPGALSNQPPVTGRDAAGAAAEAGAAPLNVSRSNTTNYEVDRTVRHTRNPTGRVQRLSVAVIVDDRQSVDEAGQTVSTPLGADEIEQITALVRETVGFDAQRGDTIQVVNKSFMAVAMEAVEPPKLWETAWFRDLVKQALGVLLVLLVVFKVLKPMSSGLLQASTASLPGPLPRLAGLPDASGPRALPEASGEGQPGEVLEPAPPSLDERVDAAKQAVTADPERVAGIMKDWVAHDAA